MKKLTVKEAAEYLKVTREAIYNRIRRGSLQSITEDGVKMVLIEQKKPPSKPAPAKPEQNSSDFEEYLKKQVDELKQELQASKMTISRLYKERDEQIKTLLQLTWGNNIAPSRSNSHESIIDADIKIKPEWIKLTKLLKELGIKKEKRAWIKLKLAKKAKKSRYIKKKNDKLFVDKNKRFKEIYEK